MARLYLFREPGEVLNVFYTIDLAVGRGCPNQREDVFLVQFFLRRVMEGWNDLPPGGPPLNIDGAFGPQTQRYIEYFQKGENKRYPGTMVEDGIVSPVANRSGYGQRSGRGYTMVFLNTHYSDRWGKAWHSNIAIDPACPTSQLPSIFWM